MLGQATSILTSSIGAGIVEGHKAALLAEQRATQSQSQTQGAREVSDDAYTATVTMILNGVNAFLYQMSLLPLYTLIALQKTVVCTANDLFGMLDVTGFVMRVGKPELQAASDVSSGVCLTKFFEEEVNSIGETGSADSLAEGASQLMQSMGDAASSILVSGGVGKGQGAQSARILTLLSGNGKVKPLVSKTVQNSINNAASKSSTLFERFKNSKALSRLGNVLGKINMIPAVHLIDSMITYTIGVISGMQDMAQVIFYWMFLNSCDSFLDFYLNTKIYVPVGMIEFISFCVLRAQSSSSSSKSLNLRFLFLGILLWMDRLPSSSSSSE